MQSRVRTAPIVITNGTVPPSATLGYKSSPSRSLWAVDQRISTSLKELDVLLYTHMCPPNCIPWPNPIDVCAPPPCGQRAGFISPEVGDDPEKVALVVPLLAKVPRPL